MKTYSFKIGNNPYKVDIESVENGKAKVCVNGVSYEVELENAPAAVPAQAGGNAAPEAIPAAAPVAASAPAAPSAAAPATAPASGEGKKVTSPLPGVILSVNVAVGDKISSGTKVAVLEAMKMENDIEAEFSGTVTAIHVHKGDSVLEGAAIVSIA